MKGKIIMTNYVTQNVCGPVVGSLVGSDKGDLSNRAKCAGAQLKNNIATLAQDTVVIGGAAGGIALAAKNKKFANIIANGVRKVANFFKPLGKQIKKTTMSIPFKRALVKFKNLPGASKIAIGGIATLGMAALSFIGCKHIYKMGQIDQKYTDKAKLEQHNKDIL